MRLVDQEPFAEAARLMSVCNACRYCEGVCAVFPAMELCQEFDQANLSYLANLCHGCSACFYDCQYAPPHEFNINLPAILAQVRTRSYQDYAWPRSFSGAFERAVPVAAWLACLSVVAFVILLSLRNGTAAMANADGSGFFYRLMPHITMVAVFGTIFLLAVLSLALGLRNFSHSQKTSSSGNGLGALWRAMRDAGSLRYLGRHGGCVVGEDIPADWRRRFHHLTFYGFLLCFASTGVATLYHYLLGLEAPYRWFQLPVILGVLGGLGLVLGTTGLALQNLRRPPVLGEDAGLGKAFLMMLWLTGVSGLMLLALRATTAMGLLLALHLGIVFALFATLPYGKFVHGLYRYAALVRHAREQRTSTH